MCDEHSEFAHDRVVRAKGPVTVQGPAVFGSDPEQVLCFKPCCRQPVRLEAAQLPSWSPAAVRCDRPRCKLLWTVEFPKTPAGAERVALWRLVTRSRE
ncbi:MAG: hypothetical protein ACRDZ4_20750 [Egibacteraceae bacterium]